MQAAHYLKSLTEVPVRDAPSAAAPHLYAISNGLAVFALSKRMVREDGQLSAWFELAPTGSGLWVGGTTTSPDSPPPLVSMREQDALARWQSDRQAWREASVAVVRLLVNSSGPKGLSTARQISAAALAHVRAHPLRAFLTGLDDAARHPSAGALPVEGDDASAPRASAALLARVCDPRGIVQLLCPFAARSGNALAALEDATHEVVSIISLRPSEWRPWRILHDSSEEMAANELVMAAATSDDVETLERVLDSASEGVARRRILRAHHSSPEMMSLTALGAAAEVGHFRAADFLLRQGAPIHARDSRGRTALHNAADGGRLAVIEVLLSAGADRLLRDRDGKLPRDLAQAAQHHAAALRLRDVPAPPRGVRVARSTSRSLTIAWTPPPPSSSEQGAVTQFRVTCRLASVGAFAHLADDATQEREAVAFVSATDGPAFDLTVNAPGGSPAKASDTNVEHSCEFAGLRPAACYEVRAAARSAAGWGAESPAPTPLLAYTDGVAPAAPGGQPRLRQNTSRSLTVVWSAPKDDNGAPIEKYRIECFRALAGDALPPMPEDDQNPAPGATRPRTHDLVGGRAREVEFSALATDAAFYFRVRARNRYGWSAWGSIGGPFRTESSIRATDVSSHSATLRWFPLQHNDLSAVRPRRADSSTARNAIEPCNACDAAERYEVQMRRWRLILDETDYEQVVVASADELASAAGEVDSPRTCSWVVCGLDAAHRYQFRVRGQLRGRWAPWLVSDVVETKPAVPSCPETIVVVDVATLEREACPTELPHDIIEAVANPEAGATCVVEFRWLPGASHGAPFTAVELRIDENSGAAPALELAFSLPAHASSARARLLCGQRYSAAVRNASAVGMSDWSSPLRFKTLSTTRKPHSPRVTALGDSWLDISVVPPTPSPRANAGGSSDARLSPGSELYWIRELDFHIRCRRQVRMGDESSTWRSVRVGVRRDEDEEEEEEEELECKTQTRPLKARITDLSPGNAYELRCRCRNIRGYGPWSSIVKAHTSASKR